MTQFPLVVAWRTLVRRPYLCLTPLLWDLVKLALAAGLGAAGQFFSRWDFAVGWDLLQGHGWYARFVLPAALPSVEQLGVPLSPPQPATPTALQIGVMLLVLALDCLVKGGFLHLLLGALRGDAPTPAKMREGALLFGWRLFVLALVWIGYYNGASAVVAHGTLPQAVLLPLNLAVIIILAVAEFVVVTADVWPPAAVLAAPLLLWQELGGVLAVVAASGLASALVTAGASLVGLDTFVVLAPLHATVGTWVTAGALYALSSEVDGPAEQPTEEGPGEAG